MVQEPQVGVLGEQARRCSCVQTRTDGRMCHLHEAADHFVESSSWGLPCLARRAVQAVRRIKIWPWTVDRFLGVARPRFIAQQLVMADVPRPYDSRIPLSNWRIAS